MQPTYIVRSTTNQRENNEDSFQILALMPGIERSPITILAVADGMGGHAHGAEVSREALRKLSLALFEQLIVEPSLNNLQAIPPPNAQSLSQVMFSALEQANAYVKRMVKANQWGKAGSTIVVAAILDNLAVVVNLGDSPMFHYQVTQRQLVKITEDHSVAGVLLRAEMITTEMARYHEGRNRLEYYLGCPHLPPEPPVQQVALAAGDLLLLCTDGISGSVSEEQIKEILAESGSNLEKKAEQLLTVSQEAGETDNQTLILWQHLSRW
ncbi:MAG: serine/threonine-protein phosphatase [Symploca sp. SIO2D2]|nr:serine/threonine-protein phosphatase [Symploca sp. SIO2D2]